MSEKMMICPKRKSCKHASRENSPCVCSVPHKKEKYCAGGSVGLNEGCSTACIPYRKPEAWERHLKSIGINRIVLK